LTGAAGGFAGGFIGGAGNAWAGGANFGNGLQSGLVGGGYGALTGGIIGGVSGGITSVRHGGNFWSGKGATFASYATADPIAGDPLKYSTETAKEYGKYFKDLKYYDQVSLYADGTLGDIQSKHYRIDGNWIVDKAGEKAYAVTSYKGIGKGSDIFFAKSAFSSARQLYLTMGHEYIHAGFFYSLGYSHGGYDKQHGSIYRWEQEVSRRWGNWNTNTTTHLFKSFYDSRFDHTKFFKVVIPWID
jgi:hypothetical protein